MYNQECQNTYPNVETNKQTELPSPFLVCNYSSLTTLNYFIIDVSFMKNVNTRY